MKPLNDSSNVAEIDRCASLLTITIPMVMGALRCEWRTRRPHDLSVPQFRALVFIEHQPGISLSALTEQIGLTLSSCSKIIEHLVQRGLLRHEVAPEDRRRARLFVSPEGDAVLQEARTYIEQRTKERLTTLAPAERETLCAAMQLLQQLYTPASHAPRSERSENRQ